MLAKIFVDGHRDAYLSASVVCAQVCQTRTPLAASARTPSIPARRLPLTRGRRVVPADRRTILQEVPPKRLAEANGVPANPDCAFRRTLLDLPHVAPVPGVAQAEASRLEEGLQCLRRYS